MESTTKNIGTVYSKAQRVSENDILRITVPKNQQWLEPIILSTDNNRNIITLEDHASATIIILHESNKNNLQTSIILQENAQATIVEAVLVDGNTDSLQQTTLNGASAKSVLIFLGSGSDNIKVNTSMFHEADNTNGQMLCRGVLLDNATANFLGQIVVPEGTKEIESHQNMECLTQGDKSKCEALPILDVQSDSVVCSHGAAIGRVEEESKYYLESRGIQKEQAEKIILHGLLMQELKLIHLTAPKIYDKINGIIKQKLGITSI